MDILAKCGQFGVIVASRDFIKKGVIQYRLVMLSLKMIENPVKSCKIYGMTAIIGDFKISSLVCFCLNAVKSYTIYFKIMETGSYQKVIKGLSKSYQKVIGENINPGLE